MVKYTAERHKQTMMARGAIALKVRPCLMHCLGVGFLPFVTLGKSIHENLGVVCSETYGKRV